MNTLKLQFILLKVVKNTCMMFNGVQFIHLFLHLVMEMDILIYGTLIEISRHQLFIHVHLNNKQANMAIKSKTMVKHLELLNGRGMEEELLLVILKGLSAFGNAIENFICQNKQILMQLNN